MQSPGRLRFASYSCAAAYACLIGNEDMTYLLDQILDEEIDSNARLSKLSD